MTFDGVFGAEKRSSHTIALLRIVFLVLLGSTAWAGRIPDISSADEARVVGRWDLIPVDLPDRLPAAMAVDDADTVWILTDGGVAKYAGGPRALGIQTLADGSGERELPSIIGHSLLRLPDGRVLASTIWREVFVVAGDKLKRVAERDISGHYSFAWLGDGRLAVALDDYRWLDHDLAGKLEALTGPPILKVEGYDALAVLGDRLFAAASQGVVAEIDPETGTEKWQTKYQDRGSVSSFRVSQDGYLYIATTRWYGPGGCYRLNIEEPEQVARFFDGTCHDLLPEPDGVVWASVDDGIYQLSGGVWRKYHSAGMGGVGIGALFEKDLSGNLWVANSLGLWRYYDYVREVLWPQDLGKDSKIEGIFLSPDGQLYVSTAGDRVFRRTEGKWSPVAFPSSKFSSPYYRKPVFAADSAGRTWVLTGDAIYKIDSGVAERVAEAPSLQGPAAPSALAICPDGTVFAGAVWANRVFVLDGGSWKVAHEMSADVGGSAVPSLTCDSRLS